jgi:hypothetical protein
MKTIRIIFLICLVAGVVGFTKTWDDKWIPLFNGKDLAGWDSYIAPDMNDSGKFITGEPIGLNKDPRKVFTVVHVNGENLIRISGENWGAISTVREYENYHLQLQFRWGELKWGQKKNKNRDSGLLYHSVGSYGADYGSWMRSQELQIEETNTGDYWGVAGGMADIPVVKKSETEYDYDPRGTFVTFRKEGEHGRHCFKSSDAEKPTGEWNTIDLYCREDSSVFVINGKVVMKLYHQKQLEGGQALPLTKGKIQIQSEGAEVFYRGIKIQTIKELPVEFANQ